MHYAVRQLPGLVQFSASRREDAVRLAVGFGQKHAVDVWYGEEGVYTLVASHRPPAPIGAPAAADVALGR